MLAVKLLKENIGENLPNLGLGKNCIDMIFLKSIIRKRRKDHKLGFIKIKHLGSPKALLRK